MEATLDNTWEMMAVVINRDVWVSGRPFKGSIRFSNKQGEEIAFNIPADKLPPIIALIAESSAETAQKIGIELSKALPAALSQTALPPSASEVALKGPEQCAADIIPDDLAF